MSTTATPTTGSTWRPRLAAVVAAAVANAVLALLAGLFGVDLVVAPPGQEAGPIAWPGFLVFSAGFALLGWGGLLLAQRVLGAGRGRLVWTVVAVLITLVMFVPPLTVEASVATVVVLVLSHVVVAAVVIPVFWYTARTA